MTLYHYTYSSGQNSANENNANLSYPKLEESIRQSYVKYSKTTNKNSLYDSYLQAFRWATDRLKNKGVISFVSNGQFIDSRSAEGVRKCLYNEFNYLYIFNLRGDARTSGEQRRKEAGNVFGSGSRTPIAISILVKDGSENHEIHYHDIGDYLSREEKLQILQKSRSIKGLDWSTVIPDKNSDWINQRDENYDKYMSLFDSNNTSIFLDKTTGITTARDVWITGFSKELVKYNSQKLVKNYNEEVKKFGGLPISELKKSVNTSDNFVKWDDNLFQSASKNKIIKLDESLLATYLYRPFTKKNIWYDKQIIQRARKFSSIFEENNLVIYLTGTGSRSFSLIVSDIMLDKGVMSSGQGYYLKSFSKGLFDEDAFNINNKSANDFELSKEDLFYYIYALLHSGKFIKKYENNLLKDTPRIPKVKNKEKYVEIGRKLADLHLNYEDVPAYEGVSIVFKSDNPSFKVKKMKHPKRGQLDTIIFNEDIVITDIPERAYEYVVNGKPAIEWIIDQYQVKKDKKSGIVDDPNEFSDNPKYIFNLLLSIINVSMQTMDLVDSLPPLEIID